MENRNQHPISIRLKVTETCPWTCKFCHKEGGWQIDDVTWDTDTRLAMERLMRHAHVSEVHYTGGEPTVLNGLGLLTAGLRGMGLTVKTTTNGQLTPAKLDRLYGSGLRSFNFSMHTLDPHELSGIQRHMGVEAARLAISLQQAAIQHAVNIGAQVKINTVISGAQDAGRAVSIYEYAKRSGVLVRFLNDLNKGQTAIDVIDSICRDQLTATPVWYQQKPGTSATTTYYRDNDGYEFGVKGIWRSRIPALCAGCRETCTEQFYGMRLEKRDGIFWVRLCLHRQDDKSLMPLADFVRSDQLKQILQVTQSGVQTGTQYSELAN